MIGVRPSEPIGECYFKIAKISVVYVKEIRTLADSTYVRSLLLFSAVDKPNFNSLLV